MKDFFTNKHGGKGFSLIEVIVATAILTVVVSGVMNVVYLSTTSGGSQKDRIIATYLASEAIEFVRADRDSHWLESGLNEMDGWEDEDDAEPAHAEDHISYDCMGNTCRLDARLENEKWGACSSDCRLKRYASGSAGYLYGYGGGGEDSRFTRSVEMEDRGEEIRVVSTVTWEGISGAGDGSVTIGESIFDYRQ